jgi:hypothetical protein
MHLFIRFRMHLFIRVRLCLSTNTNSTLPHAPIHTLPHAPIHTLPHAPIHTRPPLPVYEYYQHLCPHTDIYVCPHTRESGGLVSSGGRVRLHMCRHEAYASACTYAYASACTYAYAYDYICVVMRHTLPHAPMHTLTTIYVSSCLFICVLIPLYVCSCS